MMTQQLPPTSENQNTSTGDPFAHLHKMSTTAGVGSTEYVAVNLPAVVALLLGLATALCLLDPIFLVIAVAALVMSVISIVQVRKSNGTQTGIGMASIAILLSLAFAGFKGYTVLDQYMIERRESAAINANITQFESLMKAGQYEKAYALTSPKFQEKTKAKDFEDFFKMLEGVPYYGHMKSMVWNGNVLIFTDQASGGRYARTIVRIAYEKAPESQRAHDVLLHRVGNDWKIEVISGYFGAAEAE
jgi:hypothetical protein